MSPPLTKCPGANKVFRGLTKCQSVPCEGSNPHCDARTVGRGLLHTALCPEGGGKGGEDGDEDIEDFSPGGIVVESSHCVSWFCGLDIKVYYQMHHDFLGSNHSPPLWHLHFVTLPCREGRGGSGLYFCCKDTTSF